MSRSAADAGAAILGRFYASTYARVLGVEVAEADMVEMLGRVAASFRSDPGMTLRLPFAEAVAAPLAAYMNEGVPIERFAGIVEEVVASERPTVLDFGCGNASSLRFLARTTEARLLVGVDPIYRVPVETHENGARLVLVPGLNDAIEVQADYDLVCTMYTLHHMTTAEATSTVEGLAQLLAPGGRLFVVEDNPTLDGPPESDVDRSFAALSEDESRFVLELNDYWANVVVHGRTADFQHYTFRSPAEWVQLFESRRLERVWSRSRGFNFDRLHGVPTFESIWRSRAARTETRARTNLER